MNSRENRRFQAILACSALLHGGLFAMMSVPHKPAMPPTLMASIRLIDVSSAGSPAAPSPAPVAIPPEARQDVPRVEQHMPPRPSRTARPADVPVPAPASGVAVAAPSPAPASAAVAAAPVADAQRPAPAAAAAPAQSDMLASYRQRLTELFARGYEYPRVAAMRGWEGEVRLRLKVARKGNLLGIHLDRSSGFDVLDQHALALLEGHGALPPFPDALEGSEIQVIVPINYKLKKTT